MDEQLARRIEMLHWKWGDKDPAALEELERRIAEAGRRLSLITYSDLAKDVVFHLPNLRNGAPYRISIHNWSGLGREIIGSFLGYISMRSYRRAGFMASALAVNRAEHRPSEHFFRFMRELNVLADNEESTILEAVMNSIRISLGRRETEIAREPNRLWNPYFYAIFAQVHNTL